MNIYLWYKIEKGLQEATPIESESFDGHRLRFEPKVPQTKSPVKLFLIPQRDSDMSRSGFEIRVESFRRAPAAYNWCRASYDKHR